MMWVAVSSWQQQCCGTDFEVGSTVEWSVVYCDDNWLQELVGPTWAGKTVWSEEHHGGGPESEPRAHVRGVVRQLFELTYDLERVPDRAGPTYQAAAGTGVLSRVDFADPWSTERQLLKSSAPDPPQRGFGGWIVEVESSDDMDVADRGQS